MKKSILIFVLAITSIAGTALAQGRGRGGGLPTPPALSGPVADLVNSIVAAINKQDKDYIQKVTAPDAWWADEDGHILPANFFIGRLLQGNPPKKLTPTNMGGQVWDNGAWAAFDYTLDETLANGTANQIKGTITMTFKKAGNDWLVALIHASVNGPAVAH
jgi:ketosteroid isomerase-like protein